MSIRTDRVASMLQREVADLLSNEFREGSQSMLTITDLRVTKDLGIAYVNVSVLGPTAEERRAAFKRLEAQTPLVRQALATRIRHQVRRIPELRFFLDEGQQRSARMDALFAQIRAERGEDEAPETDGGEDERGDY
jgi:ribosome-binding factor A